MRRIAIALIVVALLTLGTSIYLHWLNFSVARQPDQTEVKIILDKEKIREDFGKVRGKAEDIKETIQEKAGEIKEGTKEKAGDIKETVQNLAGLKTVRGSLDAVDAAQNRVTINSTEQKVTVLVNAETKIRIGEREGTVADLGPGMPVMVVYSLKDGANLARMIQVESK